MKNPVLLLLLSSSLWAQSPFQIHGYIQGRFTNQGSTVDRLEIRRARVIISGEPVSDLTYQFQADLAKTPYIMDAALSWKYSDQLRFTAGQFKIPFSAESIISDNLNMPISRSRAVLALAPGRDTGVQARDTGFQIAGAWRRGGKEPFLEYTAGVFRGQTLIYSPTAHYHATVTRLLIHPIPGFTVGGDWYGSFSAPAHAEKRRYDAEAAYQRGKLQVRAEQIWARDGTLERRGGYIVAGSRFSPHWEPLIRTDWLTMNAAKSNTTSVAYMAGLNFFWRKYVKVGANAGTQHDQGPKGFSSLFLAQTALSF